MAEVGLHSRFISSYFTSFDHRFCTSTPYVGLGGNAAEKLRVLVKYVKNSSILCPSCIELFSLSFSIFAVILRPFA